MRNELLKWLREEKQEMKDAPDANVMPEYFKGCVHTLSTVIDKINSIPVPSVEGYLEGKQILATIGETKCINISDALAALQSLAADKDEEIERLTKIYDKLGLKYAKAVAKVKRLELLLQKYRDFIVKNT